MHLTVAKVPSESLALTNKVILNTRLAAPELFVVNGKYLVARRNDDQISEKMIGLSSFQRNWMQCSLGESIEIATFEGKVEEIAEVMVEVGFLKKSISSSTPIQIKVLNEQFSKSFVGIPLATDQPLLMEYHGQNLSLLIKSCSNGVLLGPNSKCNFYPSASFPDLHLIGSAAALQANPYALLQKSFKFEDLGIGGLGKEFASLFRRVFASRLLPPLLSKQFGINHVKGVLLFGPPGTGKTLIARKIGEMLNARPPKIINGPEILNKYVGQSEENIRLLFADAEAEFKSKGDASQLHIIIFDELDAICRQRGASRSDSGVGDSVVNQLLSKMDGVNQLENVVVIGMTNRIELIDEALLRPGRFEVHLKIGLPDQEGRRQIFEIHTSSMKNAERLDREVDVTELSELCQNYTGAEICGVIRAATSLAITRHIKVGSIAGLDDSIEEAKVTKADFLSAMSEVTPANGVTMADFKKSAQFGYIGYDRSLEEVINACNLAVKQLKSGKTRFFSILLHGIVVLIFRRTRDRKNRPRGKNCADLWI